MSLSNSTATVQQRALLSALGIVVYNPLKKIEVATQPWLADLCKLLKITVEDCVFDAQNPSFDDKTKTLHLPASSYANEAELKKLIWLNVRQFVI
jgi:hypothetical protein